MPLEGAAEIVFADEEMPRDLIERKVPFDMSIEILDHTRTERLALLRLGGIRRGEKDKDLGEDQLRVGGVMRLRDARQLLDLLKHRRQRGADRGGRIKKTSLLQIEGFEQARDLGLRGGKIDDIALVGHGGIDLHRMVNVGGDEDQRARAHLVGISFNDIAAAAARNVKDLVHIVNVMVKLLGRGILLRVETEPKPRKCIT